MLGSLGIAKSLTAVLSIIMLAVAVPPLLTACSVGMAMSGEEDPNVGMVRIGADRLDVERELGGPDDARLLDDGGLEATYHYELGNEPSAGRAVMHGVLDILTIGIWEVVGTPVEAVQGTEYEVTILYDNQSKVQSIDTVKLIRDNEGNLVRKESTASNETATADVGSAPRSAEPVTPPVEERQWIGYWVATDKGETLSLHISERTVTGELESEGLAYAVEGSVDGKGNIDAIASRDPSTIAAEVRGKFPDVRLVTSSDSAHQAWNDKAFHFEP